MSLFKYERIKTTDAKAKELSWFAQKLITSAKKNNLAARRHVYSEIQDKHVRSKIFDVFVPRYSQRNSGYVSVYRLVPRKSDGAKMALIVLAQ